MSERLIKLIANYLKYLLFILPKLKKSIIIYNSFGLGLLDIIFLLPICLSNDSLVLVHDVDIVDKSGNIKIKLISNLFYKYFIKNVLVHSKLVWNKLRDLDYKGLIYYIPHRYRMKKFIEINKVTPEILNSVVREKINILFFGSIKESKGLDVLLNSINNISNDCLTKINFIIAGRDKKNIFGSIKIENSTSIKRINRFISENELKYLFKYSDYIILPYKEIYQSGIAELSFCLRLPIIASNIDFFKQTISKYPSFGFLFKNGEAYDLARTIEKISSSRKQKSEYFTPEDLYQYYNTKQERRFIYYIKQNLSRIKL